MIRGWVTDAGGGMVTIVVDRETMHYPRLGEEVVIGNDTIAIAWQVAAKVVLMLVADRYPDLSGPAAEEKAGELLARFSEIEAA